MRPDTGVLPRGGVIPAGTGPGLGPVTQGSEVCSPLSRFPCGRPGLCLPASFPYLPAGDNGGEGRGGGRPPPPPPAPPAPAPLAAPNPWALGIAARSLAGAKGEVFFGSLAKGRARAVVSKAPPCPFGDGARVRRRILGRSSCAHLSEITRILVLVSRRLAKGTATLLHRCSAPQMGGCAKSREVSAVVLGGFGVGRAEREKKGEIKYWCGVAGAHHGPAPRPQRCAPHLDEDSEGRGAGGTCSRSSLRVCRTPGETKMGREQN